jgi:(p)ppGpp synthase/HD superfamily hydrolase
MDDTLVLRAKEFAIRAHEAQLDKGRKPYIEHPLRVGDALVQYGPIAQAAGYLHDTVEDTKATLAEIRAEFGDEVASAVESVTRRDPAYADRLGYPVAEKEIYRAFVARSKQHPIGRLVKIADLRDNMSPSRMAALSAAARGIMKRYQQALAVLTE